MAPKYQDETSTFSTDSCLERRRVPQEQLSRCIRKETAYIADNDNGVPRDLFLYYSDDEIRLEKLKLDGGVPEPVWARRRKRTAARRKTRLSYEMHPDALFEDLVDEMPLDQDDLLDISTDIEDGMLRDPDDVMQTGELNKMDLLRELLEI